MTLYSDQYPLTPVIIVPVSSMRSLSALSREQAKVSLFCLIKSNEKAMWLGMLKCSFQTLNSDSWFKNAFGKLHRLVIHHWPLRLTDLACLGMMMPFKHVHKTFVLRLQ